MVVARKKTQGGRDVRVVEKRGEGGVVEGDNGSFLFF